MNNLQTSILINGERVGSTTGLTFEVENPARRGEVIATVPRCAAEDVDLAVKSAFAAFRGWSSLSTAVRARLLFQIADAMESEAEILAKINSMETGSALRTQSRKEVSNAIAIFRYFAGVASEMKGITNAPDGGILTYTQRYPFGVVGAIVPWNDPLVLSAVKIAPALAAGNTIVLKSPEDAPLGILKLSEVFDRILPAGVVNVLTGYGEECGAPLVIHPLVQKVAFTGSTEVGRAIMRAASARIIPVTLELGGKSAQIVFPDALDDSMVEGVVRAMRLTRQGQSCSAGERIFVHESIFDSFARKVVEAVRNFKVGDPLDEKTDIGAMNNSKQFEKVCALIQKSSSHSDIKLLDGGIPDSTDSLSGGYYLRPAVFISKTTTAELITEETFGPVLTLIPWTEEHEVIKEANNSIFGLSAFVWSNDVGAAMRMAQQLDVGWVQINSALGPIPGIAFGGYKQSGLGREFCLEGVIESYTQSKCTTINLNRMDGSS